jgi:selenide, water dikinase
VTTDDRVLVDYRTADDAGVYRLDEHRALVQTVDFFTPIVDDPYVYGEVAAANALSDVYAMGGRPLTALAIAALPMDLDAEVRRQIFAGGLDMLRRAGVALLGGHTVQDQEIKFGYAVTGEVDPARMWTNAGARPGDLLYLTKPLGTGIVATALKAGRAPAALLDAAVGSMRTLNRAASEALQRLPAEAVHACTDVTGFGLVGHGCELARASQATLEIQAGAVPVFEGLLPLVAATSRAAAEQRPAFRRRDPSRAGGRRRSGDGPARSADLGRPARHRGGRGHAPGRSGTGRRVRGGLVHRAGRDGPGRRAARAMNDGGCPGKHAGPAARRLAGPRPSVV